MEQDLARDSQISNASSDCASIAIVRNSSSSSEASSDTEIQSLSSEDPAGDNPESLIVGREIEEIPEKRWLPRFNSSKSSYDQESSSRDPIPAWVTGFTAIFHRERRERLPNDYENTNTSNQGKKGTWMPRPTGLRFWTKGKKKLDNEEQENETVSGYCQRYSYKQLADATDNFSPENVIGIGGTGKVYKGLLGHPSIPVAIKRVSGLDYGKDQLITELKLGSRLCHRNIVRCLGWCRHRKDLMLVSELVVNGSLYVHLHSPESSTFLPWETRYKIAVDLASALHYLHEEFDQCVVHRDVKSSNVLLDSDFSAKLVDLGVAKALDRSCGEATTVVLGTWGYLDPEYFQTSKVTKEVDVYAFGVVLLEIVCGRRAIWIDGGSGKGFSLVSWVNEFATAGRDILEAVDRRLMLDVNASNRKRIKILLHMALACTQSSRELRPSITEIVQILHTHRSCSLNGDEVHEHGQEDETDISFNATINFSQDDEDGDINSVTVLSELLSEQTYPLFSSVALVQTHQTPSDPALSISGGEVLQHAKEDERGISFTAPSNLLPGDEDGDSKNETLTSKQSLRSDHDTQSDGDPMAIPNAADAEQLGYSCARDIKIPPLLSSVGPVKAHQKPIIKGILTSLCDIFRMVAEHPNQLDEIVESTRTCTAMLEMICAPFDWWKPFSDFLLQAAKRIDHLKNKLQVEEAELSSSTGLLSSLLEEIEARKQIMDEDCAELELPEEHLKNALENQLHLEHKIAYLEQQLLESFLQLEDAKETRLAREKEWELLKRRREGHLQMLDSATEKVNSASKYLEAKRKACEIKQQAISETSQIVLTMLAPLG